MLVLPRCCQFLALEFVSAESRRVSNRCYLFPRYSLFLCSLLFVFMSLGIFLLPAMVVWVSG